MKSGGEITAEVLASGSQRDKLPLLEQFSTDQLMQEIMRRYTLLQTEVADQFRAQQAKATDLAWLVQQDSRREDSHSADDELRASDDD